MLYKQIHILKLFKSTTKLSLSLLKEHIRLGQAGIVDHSVYEDQIKQNKGMDRNKNYNKNQYKCIMAHTNGILQDEHATYRHLIAA